jgi:hypothetical protein
LQTLNNKQGIENDTMAWKNTPKRGRIVNQTTTTSNNRQTNEEEALTEPVNNVCSFNDDEIALQG